MIVREAGAHDIPTLVEMGRRFFAVSGYESLTRYDPASLADTLDRLVADPNGILLVAEADRAVAGMAAAMVYPLFFARSHMTGQELFWWIDPAYRGRGPGPELLGRMERIARQKGAKTFIMGALAALRPERTGALYRRRGYAPMEHLYIREI